MLARLVPLLFVGHLIFPSTPASAGTPSIQSLFQLVLDWQSGEVDPRKILEFLAGGDPRPEELQIDLPGLAVGARPLAFNLVPSGTFTMGAHPDDDLAFSDELPQHQVEIAKEVYFSRTEVTQAQYLAVMGDYPPGQGPTAEFGVGNDLPVYYITWSSAQAFLAALNALALDDGTFRLPTEAEWEYACRAGSEERFYFGDGSDCLQPGDPVECSIDRHAWWAASHEPGNVRIGEVGVLEPNDFGLFDMSGNIIEWCEDRFSSEWYSQPEAVLPNPVNTTTGQDRVGRGGSFLSDARRLRSTHRFSLAPDNATLLTGIRVVLEN